MVIHHAGFIGASLPPFTVASFVVGADAAITPVIAEYPTGAAYDTAVDWDFGGGATNISGSNAGNVTIAGSPVTVTATAPGSLATTPFALQAAFDNITSITSINDNCALISLNDNSLVTADFSNLLNLEDISLQRNATMTSVILPNSPVLMSINGTSCGFTGLTIPNFTAVSQLSMRSNAIPAADWDAILIGLNASGVTGGTLQYNLQAGNGHQDANRSVAAAAALANLTLAIGSGGRGWTRTGGGY